MRIIDELRENVFDERFLDELESNWRDINASFFAYNAAQIPESNFLNILTAETHRKLPNYKIISSIKFKALVVSSPEKLEKSLGMRFEQVREKLCWPTWRNVDCKSQKCFGGAYPSGIEVDALVIRNKDFCLIEYENKREGLCENFMKMHWLRQFSSKQFESLFVTKLTTTKQPDGPTTFDEFNDYIDKVKTILDILLKDWGILEIVDLSLEKRRRLYLKT